MQRQFAPRVPGGADQLPGDAVALARGEEHGKTGSEIERRASALALLERALVERRAYTLRPGFEHFVEQPRVQGARRDRVDVDPAPTYFLCQRLRETDDRRLRAA